MSSLFEGLEREPGPGARLDAKREVSSLVLRSLHEDFVREKRRAFLRSLPLLALAIGVWIIAVTHPREIGGLVLASFVVVARIGRLGYEWWTLRGADAVALRAREELEGRQRRSDIIAHEARLSEVWPIVAGGLTGVVIMVATLQLAFTSPERWLAAGALVKPAVKAGEWWRLLTATYLHGSAMHLVTNAGALFGLGRITEMYDRRMRIPLVYLLAAIGGSLVSTAVLAAPSVGASGGLLGLAAYLVVTGRQPGSTLPGWIRREMLSVIGMTAVLGAAAYFFIDNAGHAGGALTGAALGWVLGPRGPQEPRDAVDALGGAAAVVLLAGAAFTILRLFPA